MHQDYSVEATYHSNTCRPVDNDGASSNTNYIGHPFGDYQPSCEYENSKYVPRRSPCYTTNGTSNLVHSHQEQLKETLSYNQIAEPVYDERTFSGQTAAKHGFGAKPNHKRSRTVFQPHQIRRLQSEFEREMYMVGMKRRNLSRELDLSEKQIKIWFQNRRMKQKRERLRKHQRGRGLERGLESFQNVFVNHGNYFEKFSLENAIAAQQRNTYNNQLLML